MKILKKIIKNEYIWSMFTKIIVVMFSLIEQIVLARYLGPALKGQVSYSQNVILVLEIVFSFGLYSIYPLYRNKRDNYSKSDRNVFVNGAIFIYGIMIIGNTVLVGIKLISGIYIGIIYISILMAFSDVQSYTFLVECPNRRNSIVLITSFFEMILYIFICLLLPPSYKVGLALLFLGEICRGTIYTTLLNPKLELSMKVLKVLFDNMKIGFLPMIALLLTSLNYKLDVIMLSNCKEVSVSDVGIYSIAIAIAEKTFLIPDSLKDILTSKLAKGKTKKEVVKITKYGFWLAFIGALGVIIVCKPVVKIFFGSAYVAAVPLIRVTVFFTTFMVLFKMFAAYNIVREKQTINTVFLIISVLLNFVLNTILIPLYGTLGAAIATSIVYVICGLMFAVYFCKTEHVNIYHLFLLNREEFNNITKNIINNVRKRK